MQQHILQVHELTKKVKFILECELNTVWLCGEISNFVAASSGHWYLSLKDSKAQVRCAMFKGSNRRVRITPRNGQQVLVRAKVSLYEPRGDFQLIIEQMDDAGEGMLRQQLEQLKIKLNAEGLFANNKKQTIPKHINRVGVVTSATGAAIKDILTVLKRRNPTIEVIIYPCLVQGEQAKDEVATAINTANLRNECQLLIVGRGGGSLEDLWSFNEEVVVRAISNSKLPIISAVGHEIDTTLSDLVADLRAATPSAAAELISQDTSEIKEKVVNAKLSLIRSIQYQLKSERQQLAQLSHRLLREHPKGQLQIQQQKADELSARLTLMIKQQLVTVQSKPALLAERLIHASPSKQVKQYQQSTLGHQQRLELLTKHLIEKKQNQFVSTIEQLNIVSPLATIARGYSVTRNKQNEIVRSIKQVKAEDNITIQLNDGQINAKVE